VFEFGEDEALYISGTVRKDKGQNFKLETPGLFTFTRSKKEVAEVWDKVLWVKKTDLDNIVKADLVDVRRTTEESGQGTNGVV